MPVGDASAGSCCSTTTAIRVLVQKMLWLVMGQGMGLLLLLLLVLLIAFAGRFLLLQDRKSFQLWTTVHSMQGSPTHLPLLVCLRTNPCACTA